MTGFVALITLLVALVGSTLRLTSTAAPGACTGAQLAGAFSVVRGSAGAGNISYRLALKNVSGETCTVTGLPQGRLLSKAGKPLPTHVKSAFPGALTAIRVGLAPGRRTFATARCSPDVPGVGEPVAGRRCEPTAYRLRVSAQGGGTTTANVLPPTPVCEHGRLLFSAYGAKPQP